MVRAVRRHELLTKCFSDRKYGGKTAALRTAMRFRDEALQALSRNRALPPVPPPVIPAIGRNVPGERQQMAPGVARESVRGPNGLFYDFYTASWYTASREPRVRRFAVSKYGEQQALRLALKTRREGAAQSLKERQAAPTRRRRRRGPRDEKHIRRQDAYGIHGWIVSISRSSKKYQRCFSDKGDRAGALARARQWRDQLLEKLPPPMPFRVRDARNTTGVIGVALVVDVGRGGGRVARYKVSWVDAAGRRRLRGFSIQKYGDREAFALAVALRRRMTKEMLRRSRASRAGRPPRE